MEVGLDIIIKQDGDHGPGDAGHHHFQPHLNGIPAHGRLGGCFPLEGPHLLPKEDHHSQDGTQLDDHQKHILKLLGDVHLDELIHQQHVPRTADGEPFRNPFYNSQKDHFDQFYNMIHHATATSFFLKPGMSVLRSGCPNDATQADPLFHVS